MKLQILFFLFTLVGTLKVDFTSLKFKFCERLKGHWAYDYLNLKHKCLEFVKEIGLNFCLDVIKNIFVLLQIYFK